MSILIEFFCLAMFINIIMLYKKPKPFKTKNSSLDRFLQIVFFSKFSL